MTSHEEALLDAWIEHGKQLECELERMRRKYERAHERCEQLREIIAADYSALPF